MTKKDSSNEFMIHCPLYSKLLDSCPSKSSNPFILSKKEEETLLTICTSEKYKKCQLYLGYIEKAA